LRLTASDGIHTASSASDPFYLQLGNPTAIIQEPLDGQTLLEGELLALAGGVMAAESAGPVQYDWYYDGNYASSGQLLVRPITEVGDHMIGLQVVANRLPSKMTVVTIHVLAWL